MALRPPMYCCSIRNTTGKQGSAGSLRALLLFYLWLLHRGLQGRSARDKSKMKKHGAFLLLLLAFWNKRRYNRMEDDSWGKLISSSGSLADINPLRYRGYYYDVETGFYYLQSRYYDPVVSRFINADTYASTGDGLLGYNMFAYCGNNPVCYSDPTGHFALVDDLLVLLGLAVVTAVTAIVTAVALPVIQKEWNNSVESFSAKPKTDYQEKAKEQVIPKERDNTVYIYRYGGTNPGNLTPSSRDVKLASTTGTGLSFSTIPKLGAARTTIDEINATGIVYAVRDGVNHVSVFPVGGTLEDWHNAGSSSVWTRAIKSVVIKWEGEID